ncbi:F-box protein CPR1-like [Silene latifolia]|uniref:F-box protein CPR1-like n=1 Tax=Silene latifolia TaxID=37657 RepID=UPI003D77C7E9
MPRQARLILIIPDEILLAIFIRVGTKDIGCCRCVSKSWCHILSELDQDFIRGHLIQSKQCIDNELLMFKCHDSNKLFSGTIARQLSGDFTVVATKLTFDMSLKSRICGPSCDGLILLIEDDKSTILLVNPTIKEVLELHIPSHDLDSHRRSTSYGLGYDQVNDDYKVVALSGYFIEHDDEMKMFVNVYSVKKSTWKQVESCPYLYDYSGVFVGGSIHWIASNYWDDSPFIARFDLTEERICKVPAPSAINGDPCEYDVLMVLGGCLCICNSFPRDEINIWVMKEYGVLQSWTKFKLVAERGSEMIPYIGVPGQRELVVLKDYHTLDERFVVYNLDTLKFQDMTIKGIKYGFGWYEGFRETLVSPYYNHTSIEPS